MRVTREQADLNRDRIVDAASELFRAHGFDGVAVSDIMKAAGLTHGGFYGHFTSKEQLASEACSRAHDRTSWARLLDGPVERRLERLVQKYLTPRHRDNPERGCLFAAVGSDVPRQPRAVRRAFTDALRAKVELLITLVPGRNAARRREQALATMAGLVGALILSRAVDDRALSDELLSATMADLTRRAGA